jgi:hypothetical protein
MTGHFLNVLCAKGVACHILYYVPHLIIFAVCIIMRKAAHEIAFMDIGFIVLKISRDVGKSASNNFI